MARLPKYKPNVSLPTNVVAPDFNKPSGLGELGRQVGNVLQIRGEQLVKEYDAVKAMSAFNAFSDSSREMVSGLTKLESGAAEGAQDAYNEWYGKQVGEFSNGLNSQPQQLMFKNWADQRRETDLNTLARHEATQYKVQKKEALDGAATDTDAGIRSAVTEGLKTPVPDFTGVDVKIEAFMDYLGETFPGHELKALKAKYTQLFRVAQMEEMMELNPKFAAGYLEKYKDDLSFVENGILKDAYPQLAAKLEKETEEDNVNSGYHAMVARHPDDPGKCIKDLYDEKIMKELGINVRERDRIVNTFKAEIVWAKNVENEQRKQVADDERKQINEHLRTGNPKGALDILDRSESIPVEHYAAMYNVINSRASDYTDWDKFNQMVDDIQNNKITTDSEIAMNHKRGIGDSEIRLLSTTLKEHQKNPAYSVFMKEAFDEWYDVEFAGNSLMNEYRVYLKREVLTMLHDPKQNFKGPDIFPWLREQAGTIDDMYNKGLFGWGKVGGSFFGWGEEGTKAPAGEKIEDLKKERAEGIEQRAKNFKQTKIETTPDTIADIPQSLILEIERKLIKWGYDVNEESILKAYQIEKGKVSKNKQGSPGLGVSF